MKFVAVCIFLVSSGMLFAQKAFTGKLVYRVEIADTSLQNMFPPSTMTIYTNDTILRVETRTDALGAQVLIQHMEKKKAYLLIESPMGKYAIQIPEKEEEVEKKYTYKKAKGKKTVQGLDSKKLLVANTSIKEQLEFYYHKKIAAKYLPGFEDFPGLLTDYYVVSTDGVYHHQLVECTPQQVSRDLFGIPSDYQKITMSDFVDLVTGGQEEQILERK